MKEQLKNNFLYLTIKTVGEEVDFAALNNANPAKAKLFLDYAPKIRDIFKIKEDDSVIYSKFSGLYPEFGKIVSCTLAFVVDGEIKEESLTGDEIQILKKLKTIVERSEKVDFWLAGHNIKQFDIPFIVKRMLKYSIDPPSSFPVFNFKPWEVKIVDIREFWQMNNPHSFTKLDMMANFLGIDINKYLDVDGEDVHELFWKGGIEKIVFGSKNKIKKVINIIELLKSLK